MRSFTFTQEKILSTKEAAELSGYTPDYLARLTRAGKIKGERFGRSWCIDKRSLEHFMADQEERKVLRSRQLVSEREKEYGVATMSESMVSRTLTTQLPTPLYGLGPTSVRSHVVALVAGFAVVFSGLIAAQGPIVPILAKNSLALANQISIGFHEEFGGFPVYFVSRAHSSVASFGRPALTTQEVVVAPVVQIGGYRAELYPKLSFDEGQRFIEIMVNGAATAAVMEETTSKNTGGGRVAYTVPTFSFVEFKSSARHLLTTIPERIFDAGVMLGATIINASHAAIEGEVRLVYASVNAAPIIAEKSFLFAYTIGAILAYGGIQAPPVFTHAFLVLAALPSHIAPVIASTAWGIEYVAADHFVRIAQAISEGYLYSVKKVGQGAYEATHFIVSNSTRGVVYASAILGLPSAVKPHQ